MSFTEKNIKNAEKIELFETVLSGCCDIIQLVILYITLYHAQTALREPDFLPDPAQIRGRSYLCFFIFHTPRFIIDGKHTKDRICHRKEVVVNDRSKRKS